jgi:hypothetical protein
MHAPEMVGNVLFRILHTTITCESSARSLRAAE